MTELEESPRWLPNDNPLLIFDWGEVFGNNHPVEVDLGAGDGSFAIGWVQQHPEINLVAVERLLGRARKIVKVSARLNLPNIRLLRLESSYFLQHMCPPESLNRIHIMFPDPWPKRRHHKNRLIQPEFIRIAYKTLVPGGEVRFSTDHQEYFDFACAQWHGENGWENLGPWNASSDPKSDFQISFEAEGKPTYRNAWRKVSD